MTGDSGDSTRTMRDTFGVWNVDPVEREAVLRSSDDQYVAVPLPEEHAELLETLADSSETIDATLVRNEGPGASWRLEEIHEIGEAR